MKIVTYGWRCGFNKIGCTNLLRSHLGYGLQRAKKITDDILDGKTVILEGDRLPSLLSELEMLDVKCKYIPEQITIYGWYGGFNKVRFANVLSRDFEYDIQTAKSIADAIHRGQETIFEGDSLTDLALKLEELGVKYKSDFSF